MFLPIRFLLASSSSHGGILLVCPTAEHPKHRSSFRFRVWCENLHRSPLLHPSSVPQNLQTPNPRFDVDPDPPVDPSRSPLEKPFPASETVFGGSLPLFSFNCFIAGAGLGLVTFPTPPPTRTISSASAWRCSESVKTLAVVGCWPRHNCCRIIFNRWATCGDLWLRNSDPYCNTPHQNQGIRKSYSQLLSPTHIPAPRSNPIQNLPHRFPRACNPRWLEAT